MSKCLRCGAGSEWLEGRKPPAEETAEAAFKRGAKAAAEIADSYNASSTHRFRLGDCILGKMNLRKGKPRRNRRAQTVKASHSDG